MKISRQNYVNPLKWRRTIGFLAVALTLNACSSGSNSNPEEKLIFARGLWETQKESRSPDLKHSVPFYHQGEILVATVVPIEYEVTDSGACWEVNNQNTENLEILKLSGSAFNISLSIPLIDSFTESIDIADIKADGTLEILVTSGCRSAWVTAFEFLDQKWVEIANVGASIFENGNLVRIENDCNPSCAQDGETRQKIEWDGFRFVPTDFLDKDGNKVNLDIDGVCAKYKNVTQLPIKLCDQGPLVEQYIALVANIDIDYGFSVNLNGDRFTPDIAKWTLTYKYRQGFWRDTRLSPTPEVDESLFSNLGAFWAPSTSKDFGLFHYDPSGKWRFPTSECPSYRFADDQTFPLSRCDYGNQIYLFASELQNYDGIEITDERLVGLFDSVMEKRIRDFQTANDFKVSGQIDVQTWMSVVGYEISDLE
jgi:hypothetical protein